MFNMFKSRKEAASAAGAKVSISIENNRLFHKVEVYDKDGNHIDGEIKEFSIEEAIFRYTDNRVNNRKINMETYDSLCESFPQLYVRQPSLDKPVDYVTEAFHSYLPYIDKSKLRDILAKWHAGSANIEYTEVHSYRY